MMATCKKCDGTGKMPGMSDSRLCGGCGGAGTVDDKPDGWTESFCPECGFHVGVDEDGLCTSCGNGAVGRGNETMFQRIRDLEAALEAAKTANAGACDELDIQIHLIGTMRVELEAAHAENARLREALEFYANPDTYWCVEWRINPRGGLDNDLTEIKDGSRMDGSHVPGKRARAALGTTQHGFSLRHSSGAG